MNYLKLKQKIYEAIERNPLDRSAYEEMFAVCREYEKIDFQTAHAWNHELRNHISWGLRMTVSCQKFDEAREFDDLMFRSLLFGAQHFFDDYLQAVEYGKPLDKKFYQPRRHYLRRYVDAYQEILDGKLCLSGRERNRVRKEKADLPPTEILPETRYGRVGTQSRLEEFLR